MQIDSDVSEVKNPLEKMSSQTQPNPKGGANSSSRPRNNDKHIKIFNNSNTNPTTPNKVLQVVEVDSDKE